MQRITEKDLQGLCDRLNELTASPLAAYVDRTAQVGNYHLSGAYGGWQLHRTHNESGGIEDVLHCGYCSKRELYGLIRAFISGIESAE